MNSIAEKVRAESWKQWCRQRDEKNIELLRETEIPEISEMIRAAIKKAFVMDSPASGIQEVIAEQRRANDKRSPETKMRIAMLQRLKATFNREYIQRALASEEEFSRVSEKKDREQFLLENWKEDWVEKQFYKFQREALKPPPPPSLRDVIDAISREPEMSAEYEDEPERFKAYEHAAECECGYGCQRISESKEGERVSLEELQSYTCKPINITRVFEKNATWLIEGELELLKKMKSLGEYEQNGWKVLRRLVAEVSLEAFEIGGSVHEQRKRLNDLRRSLRIIEQFIIHHLPFVIHSESVKRFCRVFLSAAHEREIREAEIKRLEEEQKEQRERELLAELQKYELPRDYLANLKADYGLRHLGVDRIAILEKKLSDIQLITGFRKCRDPGEFIKFFEQEVGIPDQKWRDYFWLNSGSRMSRDEGGIEKNLQCILDLIKADERFGKHAVFRDWIDRKGVPPTKRLKRTSNFASEEEALNALKIFLQEQGLRPGDLADTNLNAKLKNNPVFKKLVAYFADQAEEDQDSQSTP